MSVWPRTTWEIAGAALTLVPLAVYFGFLGAVNIRRRPTVIGGRTDFLVVIFAFLPLLYRPMLLILSLGNWIWQGTVILAVALVLWMLLPREFTSWVVYSVSEEDVARSLERILWRMHVPYTRRDNRIQCEPPYGTLLISNMPLLRNVTVYLEGRRDARFFAQVGRELREELGRIESQPSLGGHCFLAIAVTLLLTPLVFTLVNSHSVMAWIWRWLSAG